MRVLIFALMALAAAQGAAVRGVVLDEESGNPLAFTTVSLLPVGGTQAGAVSVRADRRGNFEMGSVGAGWYVLRCVRQGFVTTEAGQLRAGRPGMPFEVAAGAGASFFQLRMKRLGAVTGTVADENGVGIPDWPVVLYTGRKPLRRLAESRTDDRGNFRVGDLEAGTYLVRSGGGRLEDDTQLLPASSEAVRVRVGETVTDIVLRPAKGRMVEIGGFLMSQVPATLTLITETGRQALATVNGQRQALFRTSVAPGTVELVAEGTGCGSYERVAADHDFRGMVIRCGAVGMVAVTFTGAGVKQAPEVLVRRVDEDGTGAARALRNGEALMPGHWEFQCLTGPEVYVKQPVSAAGDGWFGVDVNGGAQISVELSNRPAEVRGVVTEGKAAVPGAAVYLEMAGVVKETRADAAGRYRFAGLVPGRYRVLSSFDFDPEDRAEMEKAAEVEVAEGEKAVRDLELNRIH